MGHDMHARHGSQLAATPLRQAHPTEDGSPASSSSSQSDLPQTPDSNGSSIYDLRQQSSEKLRLAWESIYDRFRDSHLEAQDEIYLGRRSVKGDRMRVIRDRGHLRSLSKTKLEFGCFHIDEAEIIGYTNAESDSHGDTNSNCGKDVVQSGISPELARTNFANQSQDSDLDEFLRAESKRKELCPTDSEDEDEYRKETKEKQKIRRKILPVSPTKQTSRHDELSTCQGPDKCSKSICMFCGGFQKAKKS